MVINVNDGLEALQIRSLKTKSRSIEQFEQNGVIIKSFSLPFNTDGQVSFEVQDQTASRAIQHDLPALTLDRQE